MKFNHIAQAIAYARITGDTAPLNDYMRRKGDKAMKRLLPVLSQPMASDDIYFLIAYAQAFLDVSKASLSQPERDLIENIESKVQITVVKTAFPFFNGENDEV